MRAETFTFKSNEGSMIHVYHWKPENDTVKGVVQIAHGMAETAARYERFAKALTTAGYEVYANDHRGHGKTAGCIEALGHLAEKDGFDWLIKDMKQLTDIIRNTHQGVPVFLFGHSMGSFATQSYIIQYGNNIDGAILSGSNGKQGFPLKIASKVIESEVKKKGRKAQSPKLDKMFFGTFNKAFKPTRTDFDWLSRDEAEVDKYVNDPYCGTIFTAGFFQDMVGTLKVIEQKEEIRKIPKQLPLYIFSGQKDPVGNQGKGVLKLYNAYQAHQMTDVSMKLYNDGRHEMLNELNRIEVTYDVIQWLNDRTRAM